jgi:hypothetical protein
LQIAKADFDKFEARRKRDLKIPDAAESNFHRPAHTQSIKEVNLQHGRQTFARVAKTGRADGMTRTRV